MTGFVRHAVAAAALACLALPAAHAAEACTGTVTAAVARNAGIRKKGHEGEIVAAACKLWPYDGKTMLSAVAFRTRDEEVKTLVVAMLDAQSGRVVASYADDVGEDGLLQFGDESLGIDTAPYQLAPDARAFGVRFRSAAHGPSWADAGWEDELTLFVRTGAALRPVLRGLAMSSWHDIDEGRRDADRRIDRAELSLALARTSSHGFADLTVSARIERVGGTGKPRTEQSTLRYDGKVYRSVKNRPWWMFLSPLGD
jgi:hypothetical protein